MTQPYLSIIIPVLNEEASLDAFFVRIVPILDHITKDWEMVFVDDGSTDDTAALLRERHSQDARVKLVRLSRNFGKELALTAGFDVALGKAVIPIDVDLQDPPELIEQMVEQWNAGFDVVLAVREERLEDTLFKRITAKVFYKVMGRLSETEIPYNAGDFRLMDRQVVEAVRSLPERTRFMKGILSWVGFKTTRIYYSRPLREEGYSKFSVRNLWRLALDGIFSFSAIPLKIWTYIGAVISFMAFVYASVIIIQTILFGVELPGYASLMTVTLLMGGIQLISLGVIGEYIARIYHEVKQRPLYVVREHVGLSSDEKGDPQHDR